MDLPVALCVIGRDGRLVAVNSFHATLAGRPVDDLIGVAVADLHAEGGENIKRDFRYFDAGKSVPNHEIEIRGRYYMVMVSPVRSADGAVIAISVVHLDITDKKKVEQKNDRIARKLQLLTTLDHLTGLYNRRYLDDVVADLGDRRARSGADFSLIMIDIDFFKEYNDRYGHQAGDACLKRIGGVIRGALRRGEATPCRYGGEEFAIALCQDDPDLAMQIADRIRAAVERIAAPHQSGLGGVVTVSCGVANTAMLGHRQAEDIGPAIVAAADRALYAAKQSGRNGVRLFGQQDAVVVAR